VSRLGAGRDGRTPLIQRPIGSGAPEVPILRVLAGRDVLRFVILGEGGTVEIGRDEGCSLPLGDASVSRRHARVHADAQGASVEDLGSRNGTFVNGQQTQKARLKPGDRLEIGTVPLRYDLVSAEELAHLQSVVDKLEASDRDALTGLQTRAYLDDRLPALAERSAEGGEPLSAVFIDIDHFKAVNDTYGHAIGDDVLRQAARVLAFAVRSREGCVRYGGEEILVILEGANEHHAVVVADRLRHLVEAHAWETIADGLAVTISCGVAQRKPSEDVRAWIERADRALYAAKQGGRNAVRRASQLA
jgi:two-component system cell cycle response regulator